MSVAKIFLERALFALSHGRGLIGKTDLMVALFLISKKKAPTTLRIKDLPHPVYAQSGSDVAMLIEAFFGHEYRFDEAKDVARIIDIGANIGSATLYFLKRYPQAQIISVEPDPQNIYKLEKNIAPYGNVKLIRGAVDIQAGERTFYSDKNVGMSSSFTKRSNGQQAYTVITHTLNDILKESGWHDYDLLKFDVEGAEWDIFADRPSFLPRYIIGEYHEDITGKSVEQFMQLFPEYEIQKKLIAPHRYILRFVKNIV